MIDPQCGIPSSGRPADGVVVATAVAKSGGVRPYHDEVGPDGLHRYTLRRDARDRRENEGLHQPIFAPRP